MTSRMDFACDNCHVWLPFPETMLLLCSKDVRCNAVVTRGRSQWESSKVRPDLLELTYHMLAFERFCYARPTVAIENANVKTEVVCYSANL